MSDTKAITKWIDDLYAHEQDPLVRRAMVRLWLLLFEQDCVCAGASSCRDMMAGFVEGQGHPLLAVSIRANWNPAWGKDPSVCGVTRTIPESCCHRGKTLRCMLPSGHDGLHGESSLGPFFDPD